MKRCNIPARTLPACDLEWGHDGDMHANAGDGFYAREFLDEHHRRQKSRLPAQGEIWRRRRDGREARIVGGFDRLVLYRYRHAVDSRGRTGMIRTNTTAMGLLRFLAAFEKLK